MLLQYIVALLHHYAVDCFLPSGKPISIPGNPANMAKILARLVLLLIGADTYTPYIINSVWEENNDAHLALSRPHGDLSLIRWCLLALSKIVINTIYILRTNPDLPILVPKLRSFTHLPPTLQTLLQHSGNKITYACEPVLSGTAWAKLLTDNLGTHISPNSLMFKNKANQCYRDLLCVYVCVCVWPPVEGGYLFDAVSTARWIHPPQCLRHHTPSKLRTSASPRGDVSWWVSVG